MVKAFNPYTVFISLAILYMQHGLAIEFSLLDVREYDVKRRCSASHAVKG